MKKNAFVFVACGDGHAARTNIALKFLKHFSKNEIIVVKSRTNLKINCDQIITPKVPAKFDNHQAGIFLKTSLHKIVDLRQRKCCYLDNDVVAVAENVDDIFHRTQPPISFALDHCHLRQFSRYAVNCECKKECEHLHQAIRKEFGIQIADAAWPHWNGGVFVFDEASIGFMDLWHDYSMRIFNKRGWRVRDQGTLAATVWKLKLQNHRTLPREFNYLVDRFGVTPHAQRKSIRSENFLIDESYSLNGDEGKPRPFFLHFINGGIGQRGWKNWDDAEQLLSQKKSSKVNHDSKSSTLSPDNRVVHGLWVGQTLSKMELLTIHSFLRHGHEFHLWVYDKLQTPLPKEVVLEDANKIIPQKQIIKKAETDPETGIGKGSYSSPFSDLFRYKLLYEKGGYWVDMDVTCLRPFNFSEPYVFRPHRVGVVGNIIKCPPRSRLMKLVYEKVARHANAHSEWLMPNRVLSQTIQRLKLNRYIRAGIWNEESWWDAIRPLALGDGQISPDWFAIHWINEFWRVLKENGGVYRGKRLFETVPEKDSPKPGSRLEQLYLQYGLSASAPVANGATIKPISPPPLEKQAERQPPTPHFLTTSHINVLLPSLTRGGAERSVLEILSGLQRRNSSGKLFILHNARPSYGFDGVGNIKVHRLGALDMNAKLHSVAVEVLASPESVLFTHMVKAELLRHLWERGVKTVPVIQNSKPSWQDFPKAFNHPKVPFIVAVSEAVAQELRKCRCPKPVVVLRHELQRWFTPEEQQQNRRNIRDRFGISDDTIVIGMVGEFKSQKAYTRAVRVLAQLRQSHQIKLMILGGWDHEWGYGRQAYTATCRLALELDVMPDMIMPGPVPDVEKYYAAFDVFLNTSAYEGLSVALLEAIQTGCPIVTADAGGNRETLQPSAILVDDSSDTDVYVRAIGQALQIRTRPLVQKPADFDLVPRLWCLLGRYAYGEMISKSDSGKTLFITDNLPSNGAQNSLVQLLCNFSKKIKLWLCVLQTVSRQNSLGELQKNNVPVFSVHNSSDYFERVERILHFIEQTGVRSICFWNVEPRIKLLLAKILPAGSIRLIDVIADSSSFFQMEHSENFQRRISFSAKEYWGRLDKVVAKYPNGTPPDFRLGKKMVVIPDGIAKVSPEPQAKSLAGVNPDLIIGTICQIAPGKRMEFLLDTMTELNRNLTGVTLVILGELELRHQGYWPILQETLRQRQITNIYFAGIHEDTAPWMKSFKIFLSIFEWPGFSSDAGLAMALGIPVATNCAEGFVGTTASRRNFIFEAADSKTMAHQLRGLLLNPASLRRAGKLSKKIAAKKFSVRAMADAYTQLLS